MPQDHDLQHHYAKILPFAHPYPAWSDESQPLPPSGRLHDYGLPAQPKPDADPELHRFWTKLLGRPLKVVAPEFPRVRTTEPRLFALHRHGFGAGPRPNAPSFSGFGHLEDSANWSGGYLTPIRPYRFTQVFGGWTVPDVSIPNPLPIGADPLNEDYRSSTWIGIGGHRPYNSLPQIGTAQHLIVRNGVERPEFGCWWQWWVKDREEQHIPIPILNMTVKPGDEMLASIMIEAPGDAHFLLKNHTTGVLVTFKVVAPAGISPLGTTAEWIHERPTKLRSNVIHHMPRFSDVDFEFCIALSAPAPGVSETLQKLDAARLIRMYEHFDAPFRSHFMSVPKKTGPTSLRIAYA